MVAIFCLIESHTMTHDNLTGAELQTLREGLHLTRDDLAALAGVQARTVKHWENGRSGVPGDVANMVQGFDRQATQAARATLASIGTSSTVNGATVFLRYRSTEDLNHYEPTLKGLPASVHAAIVSRVRLGLQLVANDQAQALRVVWFDPADFEAWRTAHQQPRTPTTRQQWAAQALPTQATPHQADQPPA